MANKRQLRKAIHNACSEMAAQCLMAQEMLCTDEATALKWGELMVNIAQLQENALSRIGRGFDKAQTRELTAFFTAEAQEIAKKMNALLPKKG